jgi:hypothetical protein
MPWIDSQRVVRDNEPAEQEIQEVEEFARRKAKPRFYADENFPTLAVSVLRDLKAHVLTVQANRARGHPDGNHVAAALRLGRILITCDRDYRDERRFPLIHCPAIVVCDFGAATLAEIRQTFRCMGPVFVAPQFFDKWWKIDAKRDSWTVYARHLDGTTARTRHRFHNGQMQEWAD